MATPYDNHDPGFTREERKIAADYGIDLDAPEQLRCDDCNIPHDPASLNADGICATCVTEIHAQECATFVSAPTLAGCLELMGAK